MHFRIYFEALCLTGAAPAYDVDLGRAVAIAGRLLQRATAAKCELSRLLRLTLLQGCTKRLFPGFVKLGEKVAFCLPTAGRRTHLFTPYSHNLGSIL